MSDSTSLHQKRERLKAWMFCFASLDHLVQLTLPQEVETLMKDTVIVMKQLHKYYEGADIGEVMNKH